MDNPSSIIWRPVKRSDISWNFEKFLVGPDGLPVKRYSKSFLTADIEEDIEELLRKKTAWSYVLFVELQYEALLHNTIVGS